jgi:two-component system phosphate regulon sensor histidine kinase PhoR
MKRVILVFECALVGLSILLTAVLINFAVYHSFSERMKLEIAAESSYIGAGVELAGQKYLESITPLMFAHRVTLISQNGFVLFDSEHDAESMENHMGRSEVAEAARTGTGESVRFSETMRKQTCYFARKLGDGTILRVSNTTDSVFVSVLRLIAYTHVILAVVFLAALWVGSKVTGRIVDPINMLDLENPEDNAAYEELSPLLTRIKKQNDRIVGQMNEMRKKQIEFSAITRNMREGLLVLDKEARVLSYNHSALSLLRAHPDGAKNQNVLTLRRDEQFRRVVERALGGIPSEVVLTIEGAHLQIIANPVADNGDVQGAVIMLLDVTEREDREKLRREFSANVSHELKTPLTAILGYAEILSNGIAHTEDTQRFALNIYAEAQRLIALINDIMMLSKLDEDSAELSGEPVDLCALVRNVVERVEGLASERNITISLDCESVEITAVRNVLDEMAFNLLDNAVKYNAEGGRVSVSIERTPEAVVLTVADTGIGIPPEEQERVFERFYRVDKSRNKSVPGTGLGLSIVKHGAMLHNAKAEVRSDGKSGTTISIVFPTTPHPDSRSNGLSSPSV